MAKILDPAELQAPQIHHDDKLAPTIHYETVTVEFNAAELALLERRAAAEHISPAEFAYRAVIARLKNV
ncbi:MAG: hypothetical protein IJ849_01840 [Selenomonadaceae bacterium]|nr:hypothetical protein [Selenomonadaceae bacterium]